MASTIVVLNRDAFFGIRIANTLRALGYTVELVKSTSEFSARLSDPTTVPALGVVDMNAAPDWGRLAELTGPGGPNVPLLAFGSHLDVESFRAAKTSGVTRVVSNGDFHRDMVALVERYARR